MKKIEFRQLDAGEIECRVNKISEKGLQLLLYKDARCDMSILDETVGTANWQRKHELINGNLFCSVGINVAEAGEEPCWIWKEDVGTESNTEKEKGQASDSFKRACVNWGIGRELYTSPFIWIAPGAYRSGKNEHGKLYCKDSFSVQKIKYDGKKISELEIVNENSGESVFTMGKKRTARKTAAKKQEAEPANEQEKKQEETKVAYVTKDMINSFLKAADETGMNINSYLQLKGLKSLAQLQIIDYRKAMNSMEKKKAEMRHTYEKQKEEIDAMEGLPF